MAFVMQEDMYETMDEEPARNPMPWLHGQVSRGEVARLFQSKGAGDGSFLIRESTQARGEYVLSLLFRNEVEHYKISNKFGKFCIDDGPPFTSLQELVTWYSSNPDRLPVPLRVPIAGGNQPAGGLVQQTANMALGGSRAPAPSPGGGGFGRPPASLPGGGGPPMGGAPAAGGSRKPAPPLPSEDLPSLPRRGAPPQPTPQAFDGPSPYSMSDTFQGTIGITPADEPLPAPPSGGSSNPLPLPSRGGGGAAAPVGRTFSATSVGSASSGGGGSGGASGNRADFTKHSRVKKWIDRQDEALSVDLQDREEEARNLPEGYSKESMETAAKREENFRKAALAEEKLYVTWMNNHLKKVNRSVDDIGESLQDGTVIIEVIKSVTGQKAPAHSKKALVVSQQIDNWHVIVNWLKKLGVPVENTGDPSDPHHNVGLNPVELHKLDRREILKLFSKLMQFESQLMRQR